MSADKERCGWCQDYVWSDSEDRYETQGYVFHRSCAAMLSDLLRDFDPSSPSPERSA